MIKMKTTHFWNFPLQTKDDLDSGHEETSQERDEVQAWVQQRATQGVYCWSFKCGSENGCGGVNNVEILCCGVASSCGYGCCSGSGFCCGYESVSARSSGCGGRPPLRGCKRSHPRKHITDRFLTQNRLTV